MTDKGWLLAPEGEEYHGDVGNVLFSNGWIADDDGRILIYYASSDTRMHVAVTSVERLTDYCFGTEQDGLTSSSSTRTLCRLIDSNIEYMKSVGMA